MHDPSPADQDASPAGDPLLKTKLFIPRVRRGRVPRQRLVERLNRGTQGALTLVSAPPGFGKTTILAEWAAQSPLPVAWLSLDAGDNDPRRFFAYLIAAVEQVARGAGAEAGVLLDASQPYPPQMIAASLLVDLEALPQPLILVLDDYHVIDQPALHGALAFLLEHLPAQLRLVLATRADPPIPLARLRARGELQELRADDLRFSAAETAVFLKQVMGLDLQVEDIAALEARTEGWIAGLHMAALSMQGRQDLSTFVQAFSGSHRFILDYLVEEVISRQPETVQRFLLRTSILERLSGPLCSALFDVEGQGGRAPEREPLAPTALKDSQAILEYLEKSNLFVTPLDDERRWYRYHHLFADLLRVRLQGAEPVLVPSLHLQAAGWYEQNGFVTEAVGHAFAAQDYEYAADLIEEHGHRHWSLSDTQFLSLVRRLPAEVLYARPILGVYQAWTLFIFGQYEATEALLRALVPRISPASHAPADQGISSFINLLLIYIDEMSGKGLAATLPDRHALEFVPEHHLGMRNSADVLYAFLLDQRGDFAASEELLLQAAGRDIAANGATAVPICMSRLARNWVWQGRLRDAAGLCQRYIEYIQARGEKRFFIAGSLYLALAGILREWNELEQAGRMIQAGFQANEPWQLPQVDMTSHMARARWQQSQGDLDGALATLEKLDRLIQGKSTTPDLKSDLRYLKVRLWLARGEREKAWKQARLARPTESLDFRDELDHMVLARLFLSESKLAEALDLLERLAEQAEAGGRLGRLLELRLLTALALARLKRVTQAFDQLDECLALAEQEGYLRIFLDEGDDAQALLHAYLRAPAPRYPAYASRILQAFEPVLEAPAAAAPARAKEELVEPLTRRELEVLGLLCAGDSNQDIAEKLFITLSAVKKHTGNIYGKLGVSSRTQAIARARQLDLLPPES